MMMHYPRVIIPHNQLYPGRHVYVKELDVFGYVQFGGRTVLCQSPMQGYPYSITPSSILYDDAIGERDPENPQ